MTNSSKRPTTLRTSAHPTLRPRRGFRACWIEKAGASVQAAVKDIPFEELTAGWARRGVGVPKCSKAGVCLGAKLAAGGEDEVALRLG